MCRVWLGEPELAIDHLQRAMRLSPVDALMFMMQGAMAFGSLHRRPRRRGVRLGRKGAPAEPFHRRRPTRIAAASAAFLGRPADAAKYLALLRQLDPGLLVSNLDERVNLRRAEDLARLAEGLRKAGLPE